MAKIISVILLLFTPPAFAANGFYFGLGPGTADQDISANATTTHIENKTDGIVLTGGYDLNRHLAIEAGYTNFGKANITDDLGTTSDSVYRYEHLRGNMIKRDAITLAIIGKAAITKHIDFVGKVGAGYWQSTTDINDVTEIYDLSTGQQNPSTSTPVEHTESSNIDPILGLGISLNLENAAYVRGEYVHYMIDDDAVDMMSVSVLIRF